MPTGAGLMYPRVARTEPPMIVTLPMLPYLLFKPMPRSAPHSPLLSYMLPDALTVPPEMTTGGELSPTLLKRRPLPMPEPPMLALFATT